MLERSKFLVIAVCMMFAISAGCLVMPGSDPEPIEDLEIPAAGLQLWLMADKGVTTDSSGKLIQWKDQSRQGNNAVIATESAPVLVEDAFDTYSAIRFDGTTFARVPHSDGLNAGDAFTFIAVHRNANDGRLAQKKTEASGTQDDAWFVNATQGLGVAGVFQAGGQCLFPDGDTVHVQSNVFSVSEDKLEIYGSGELLVSLTGVKAQNHNGDDLFIGIRDRASSPLPWKGDLYEIVIYNRALTDEERQEIEQYLFDKYGMEGSVEEPAML